MRISDLERKTELENIQEDLSFIKDHISSALENSRKITYDLSPPVLYQLGIIDTLSWFAGNIENKGIEIMLYATPVKTIDFNWNISMNFAKNNNKAIPIYCQIFNPKSL